MDYAFKNKKPVLAICRGFQVLNVFFGGTLYQDLGTEIQTPVKHRDAEIYDCIHHEVELVPMGILTDWYGLKNQNTPKIRVNSVHHQGIKKLGRDLVVDAISPDDKLIEAIHYANTSENFMVGVQWHPEFSYTLGSQVSDPKPIYDHFLKAVESKRTAS
jgi:putative glutamine amidotransferase